MRLPTENLLLSVYVYVRVQCLLFIIFFNGSFLVLGIIYPWDYGRNNSLFAFEGPSQVCVCVKCVCVCDTRGTDMCETWLMWFVCLRFKVLHRCVWEWFVCVCDMGWLRSVGSIKLQVSFAEYRLFYRPLLQKRPIILSILLTEATPYVWIWHVWRLAWKMRCVEVKCVCETWLMWSVCLRS